MSDIFISYSKEDRAQVEVLAHALEAEGFSIWWDRVIPAGRKYDDVIEEALDAARCVIVLWSKRSVESDWVRNEVQEAADRDVLVPILIEDVKIPLAFRRIQAADLIGWSGDTESPAFRSLLADIVAIAGGDHPHPVSPPTAVPQRPTAGPPPTATPWFMKRGFAVGLGAVVLAAFSMQ